MQNIVAIIPQIGFNDTELFTIKKIFEHENIRLTIASFTQGKAYGKYGGEITVHYALTALCPDDYIGVLFVGGYHIGTLATYPQVTQFIQALHASGKLIGAHCVAPAVILASLGLLKGKKATVFATKDGWSEQELKDKGATLVNSPAVIDGNLITGRNENEAADFATAYLTAIKKLLLH